VNSALQARCHAAIDRFVSQRDPASAFLSRFDELWAEGETQDADSVLRSVRHLCLAYAHALAPGAGYRVREEQFRVEVQSLILHRPSIGHTPVNSPD
jgi:hypothetical protein